MKLIKKWIAWLFSDIVVLPTFNEHTGYGFGLVSKKPFSFSWIYSHSIQADDVDEILRVLREGQKSFSLKIIVEIEITSYGIIQSIPIYRGSFKKAIRELEKLKEEFS